MSLFSRLSVDEWNYLCAVVSWSDTKRILKRRRSEPIRRNFVIIFLSASTALEFQFTRKQIQFRKHKWMSRNDEKKKKKRMSSNTKKKCCDCFVWNSHMHLSDSVFFLSFCLLLVDSIPSIDVDIPFEFLTCSTCSNMWQDLAQKSMKKSTLCWLLCVAYFSLSFSRFLSLFAISVAQFLSFCWVLFFASARFMFVRNVNGKLMEWMKCMAKDFSRHFPNSFFSIFFIFSFSTNSKFRLLSTLNAVECVHIEIYWKW